MDLGSKKKKIFFFLRELYVKMKELEGLGGGLRKDPPMYVSSLRSIESMLHVARPSIILAARLYGAKQGDTLRP